MKYLRHPVAALVLFTILVSLSVQIYDGMVLYYGVVPTAMQGSAYTNTTGNIMEQFKSMNLISGINSLQTGIMDLSPPAGAESDILGGLASVGIGALKSVASLVTTPFEILGIVGEYYVDIPAIITQIAMIIVVYVSFILLSAYLRSDV